MSIASSLITSITVWRNPEGAEKNWKGYEDRYTHLPSFNRIAISEAAFAAIGMTALVESVMNAVFVLFSLPFILVDDQSYHLPLERLKSSAFAAVWCGANLVLNITVSNMTANEETARNFTNKTYHSLQTKFG